MLLQFLIAMLASATNDRMQRRPAYLEEEVAALREVPGERGDRPLAVHARSAPPTCSGAGCSREIRVLGSRQAASATRRDAQRLPIGRPPGEVRPNLGTRRHSDSDHVQAAAREVPEVLWVTGE